jgi:DNA-binding FadR family transcriptional regulator
MIGMPGRTQATGPGLGNAAAPGLSTPRRQGSPAAAADEASADGSGLVLPLQRGWHRPVPLHQPKLGEQLYEYLRDLIASGKLVAGAQLPTEKQLCETFHISRPVVREALARLRMENLIVSRRGSGSYVEGSPSGRPAGRVRFAAHALVPDEREARLASLLRSYELRIPIESDAAYYAARHHRSEHLTMMTEAMTEMEAAVARRSLDHDAHFKFHLAVALATRNPLFVNALCSLRPFIDVSMNLFRDLWLLTPDEPIDFGRHQHAEIHQAIAAGDPEAARRTMHLHIDESRREIFGELGDPWPEIRPNL